MTSFKEINKDKINLDHIYNREDPRAYFQNLSSLDYIIPGEAKPVFQQVISHLEERNDGGVRMLDLGCSYGVNAALLKHDLSLDDLYEHWGQSRLRAVSPKELIAYDRRFFSSLESESDLTVIGLDQAENAVTFAAKTGLVDRGIVANLEVDPLAEEVKPEIAQVDLVTSTGCIGYVTERTFDRLLPTVTKGKPAWIANFVLRIFPFDKIARTLERWGYRTERLAGQTFIQRRFASAEEQGHALQALAARGIDPAGKEERGYFHAEFFLSRREAEVESVPLAEMLSDGPLRAEAAAPLPLPRAT